MKSEFSTASPAWQRSALTVADLEAVHSHTITWHNSLGVWHHPNTLRDNVRDVLLGEIAEAESEHAKEGTPNYSVRAHQQEALDTAVPAHAFAMRRRIAVDLHEVRRHLNGYGSSSAIYDHLREVAGNLPDTAAGLEKDLEWFLVQAYSLMWHLPEIDSPAEIVSAKMAVNRRNYPEMYYTDVHATGRKLRPDEKDARYFHSNRCLRLIRKHYNRPEGLLWSDHAVFAELILDFEHADRNYQLIATALQHIQGAVAL